MGKGSNRRQAQVSDEEMARRWSDTFGGNMGAVWEAAHDAAQDTRRDYGNSWRKVPRYCIGCDSAIPDSWNVYQIDHNGTIKAPYCQDCYERLTIKS